MKPIGLVAGAGVALALLSGVAAAQQVTGIAGLAKAGTGVLARSTSRRSISTRHREAVTRALAVAAVAEIATGLALLLAPALVGQVLLGADLTGLAATVARVAGLALIGLGIACWPGPPRLGMVVYSAAVGLYLAYLGLAADLAGILLWPAVILHLLLAVLIGLDRKTRAHR